MCVCALTCASVCTSMCVVKFSVIINRARRFSPVHVQVPWSGKTQVSMNGMSISRSDQCPLTEFDEQMLFYRTLARERLPLLRTAGYLVFTLPSPAICGRLDT